MVGTMISLQFDPFDRTHIFKTDIESLIVTKILHKMDRLLQSKILSHHYKIPFSEITFLHNN